MNSSVPFLFQDVHFRAVQLGNEQLAERAKQRAQQISLRDQLEGVLKHTRMKFKAPC